MKRQEERAIREAHKNTRLVAGDECWFLYHCSIYEVVVTRVRVACEGEPLEFAMYEIAKQEAGRKRVFEEDIQHRHDLYRRSNERPALILELEERIDVLANWRDEMRHAQEEAEAASEATQ
jgi:hypothetical protein